MTTGELQRKLDRIVLDLEDLAEEPYLRSDDRDDIEEIIKTLKYKNIYSNEL